MACWVWERVADQDKSFRAYAFSVIMCLLEGRLAIESLVEQARNGVLPERLKPASFVFNELKPNIKQLLAESSLIKTTPVMRSRFKNPTGVTHCFPLFKQAVGTLACVAPHDPEVLKHRPAYFVLQTSNGWKLYFSDIRDDKPEFVAFGKGRIENFEKKICDKAKAHLLEILLHQTGKTFALQNLGQERFFDVRPVPASDVSTLAVYEDMLAHYKESIAKLLIPPHGRRIRDPKEKENFEKMYDVMREGFGHFFPSNEKHV